MEDDEHAVRRRLDVELDEVRAELDRPLERGQRVLALLGGRAAMRDDPGHPTSDADELDVDLVDDRVGRREPLVGERPAHRDTAQARGPCRRDARLRVLERDDVGRLEVVAERLERPQVALRVGLAARHVVGGDEDADGVGEARPSRRTGSISRR